MFKEYHLSQIGPVINDFKNQPWVDKIVVTSVKPMPYGELFKVNIKIHGKGDHPNKMISVKSKSEQLFNIHELIED